VRVVGWAYPAFMLVTIVGTGNHFFFDAITGGIVVGAAYFISRRVAGRAPDAHWRGRSEAAVAPC
jgi:hypothetical protein